MRGEPFLMADYRISHNKQPHPKKRSSLCFPAYRAEFSEHVSF